MAFPFEGLVINSNPIKIAIAGAGRMGQSIAGSVEASSDLELVGLWARGQDIEPLVERADVVIDFSLPAGTEVVVDAVRRLGKPLVCGVSGLNDEQLESLKSVSEQLPLVYDRNMSIGIAVVERCVREAAGALGIGFDVEVAEVHHAHKKDAPSGTALKLAEAAAAARGESGTGTISFEVERRGEVPGDHDVIIRSATEKLTFSHSVTTRQVFADGALRAARWVANQPPGLYSMHDVLFTS